LPVNSLEPNLIALFWFVLLWGICCLGFFQLAGMYPIRRGEARDRILLVLCNSALWLALVTGTFAFAWTELRWTTMVVTAGIVFLFTPALFQAMPDRLRDGSVGMVIGGIAIVVALGLLVCLVAGPMAPLHA
jgi:hypothetical protein